MWKRSSWKLLPVGALFAVCLLWFLSLSAPGEPPIPAPSLAPLASPASPPAKAAPAGEANLTAKPSPAGETKQVAKPSPEPAPVLQQSYIGVGACSGCHRPQAQAWDATKHAREFSGLPVNYRNDPPCLQCHVTAYGTSSGYSAGMPAESSKDLAVVGCELCHGPGTLHKNAAERFANSGPADEARLEKEMKATIQDLDDRNPCHSVGRLARQVRP